MGGAWALHRPSQGEWDVVHAATHPPFGPALEDVGGGTATARGALARDVRPRRCRERGLSRGSRAGGFSSGNLAGTSRITRARAKAATTGRADATADARERERCGARRGHGDAGRRRDAHVCASRRVRAGEGAGQCGDGTVESSKSETALT